MDLRDTDTWEAAQPGALDYAKGCFMALKNSRAHLLMADDEDVAVEQFAAFSVLARRIEECDVVEAERVSPVRATSEGDCPGAQ